MSTSHRSRYAAIVLVVLALCLAPIGLPNESELQQRIFDALHIPLFAAVGVAALSFRAKLSAAAIGGVTLLVIFGATAIEFIQPSFGRSATRASVVSIRPATEDAFCSAQRTTLAGSMTSWASRSP